MKIKLYIKKLFIFTVLLGAFSTLKALELSDCRISAGPGYPSIKARCGALARPLNPANPGIEEISLNIAVIPALSLEPESDPLVPLAGGPGSSAIEFYGSLYRAFEAIRQKRDILLVDQRGTGNSARMDCPITDDVLNSGYSDIETRNVSQECLNQLPHDPRYFTTSIAVQDLEAVRKALGYSAFNLLGTSYGTRVAQHFARRYPQSSRTIILDGVVPPQQSLGPDIARESQRALDEVFVRCAASPTCHKAFPDLKQIFVELRENLAAKPMAVTTPDPISAELTSIDFGPRQLGAAIRLLAYQPRTLAILPLMISEASKGNLAPIVAHYQLTTKNLTDSMALGMHNSIMCTEDIPFVDRETVDMAALEATYLGSLQFRTIETICSIWPMGVIDEDFNQPLATNLPVLLLSGSTDPVTPPAYAEMALVDMTNFKHISNKHQGHGQIAVGCMPEVISKFVESASPLELDTSCLKHAFVLPFFTSFAGPSP